MRTSGFCWQADDEVVFLSNEDVSWKRDVTSQGGVVSVELIASALQEVGAL